MRLLEWKDKNLLLKLVGLNIPENKANEILLEADRTRPLQLFFYKGYFGNVDSDETILINP